MLNRMKKKIPEPFGGADYHCFVCGSSHNTKFSFVNHLVDHLSDLDVNFSYKTGPLIRRDIINAVTEITNCRITAAGARGRKVVSKNNPIGAQKDCISCKLRFEDDCLLALHERLVHQMENDLNPQKLFLVTMFECDVCGSNFPSLDDLEAHVCDSEQSKTKKRNSKAVSEPARMLPEEFAPIQFILPSSSTVFKRFLCHVCDMIILSERVCHFHLMRHHPDYLVPEATNICPKCRRFFKLLPDLAIHISSHHCESSDPLEKLNRRKVKWDFVCEVCSRFFKSYRYYESHMITHRAAQNSHSRFKCKECEAVFLNSQQLYYHQKKKCFKSMQAKNGTNTKSSGSKLQASNATYMCIYCSERLSSPKILGKHVKRLHKQFIKGKSFCCPDENCHLLLASYSNVARHFRKYHFNECSFCHRTFDGSKIEKFKIHILRHSLFRLRCNFCHRLCYTRSILKTHVRQSHSNMHVMARHLLTVCLKRVRNSVHGMDSKTRKTNRGVWSVTPSTIDQSLPGERSLQSMDWKHQGSIESVWHEREATGEYCLGNSSVEAVDDTPSSVERMNFYGTLQLGEIELPLYQLNEEHLNHIQLHNTMPVFSLLPAATQVNRINTEVEEQTNDQQIKNAGLIQVELKNELQL